MTTATVQPTALQISFTTREKVAGLIRNQQFPLTSVRSAEVVADGLAAVHGVRSPGLGLPGARAIGTWRGRSGKTLVSVRRGRPALRVLLDGQPYAELLLDVDDAARLAAALAPTR
ncbi:hypothetical protein [Georgenia sp. SYP-B2076]|uniref:hypothetical protein n=1 Tax=Georgenia sp. SYP-B2076 TaxID=2495881 RepID=UPI000F8CB9A7|nr:hypothetical protein [Georgenia sp. SYP-B2076]